MGKFRILGEGESSYHTWTRCIDGTYYFKDDKVKAVIRMMIMNLSRALQVDIGTYCIMSNHYHLLTTVPDKSSLEPLSGEQWLDRLSAIYDASEIAELRGQLEQARDSASSAETAERRIAEILQPFENRRADLAVFMKELNQRISIYINDRFDRRGTVWESPYGSTYIEGNQGHLLEAAAYIDLNPVRAKLVDRPEDYRFCGYAEAVAGKAQARKALGKLLSEYLQDDSVKSDWRRTHRRYRSILYPIGKEELPDPTNGSKGRAGIAEAEVEKVEQADGEMSIPEMLRHRVRYFTAGCVIGSRSFVESVFQRNRHRFGPTRTTGARRMRGAQWGDSYCLRDLKRDVIGT